MPNVLLMERNRGGKLALDPLVVKPDTKKHLFFASAFHIFTNAPNRVNPAKPKQNQPAMNWCVLVRRKIPPASDATNMKSQVKLPTPEDAPLSLPLPRPRKPIHLLCPLLASLTSICPASSLVMTCAKERGSVSNTLPMSSDWLKSRCSVCSIPSASRPRNLRA